jgi:hypothetical protein
VEDGTLLATGVRAASLYCSGTYAYVQGDNRVTICLENQLAPPTLLLPDTIGSLVMGDQGQLVLQVAQNRAWYWRDRAGEKARFFACTEVQSGTLALLVDGKLFDVSKGYALRFDKLAVAGERTDDILCVLLADGELRVI